MSGNREYDRAYGRELYHWCKEHNVCTQCVKKKAEPGRTMCWECAEKQAENKRKARAAMSEAQKQDYRDRRREKYREYKAKGLCTRCGRPAAKGSTLCLDHSIRRRRTAAQLREKHRVKTDFSDGLCCKCNEPAVPGKKLCARHCVATKKAVQAMAEKCRRSEHHAWIAANWLLFGGAKRLKEGEE